MEKPLFGDLSDENPFPDIFITGTNEKPRSERERESETKRETTKIQKK